MNTQYELLWKLEELRGVNSLLEFIPRVTKGYQQPTHLLPLLEAFLRAETERVRVCASTPPRHAKTETLLHLCIRYLKKFPKAKIAYVTYAQDLADEWSRKADRFAEDAGLKFTVNNLRLKITEAGGEFIFTSIDGGLVGKGVNLLIVDDPYKNRQQADSATTKEHIYDWFKAAARTRLEPNASVFIIHHRWSPDDLIGCLLEEGYENITLPAIRNDGTALWPERWSLEELEQARKEVTEREWAALYMGQPIVSAGAVFLLDVPRYTPAEWDTIRQGLNVVIGVDPAATAATKADFSVIAVLGSKGVGVNQKYWLLEVTRLQVTIPDLVKRILEVQERWKNYGWNAPVYVEAVSGFKSVPQTLHAINPALMIKEAPVKGDKYTRALPLAAAWESQRFFLPESANWLNPLLAEFRAFTGKNDPHDDTIDAVAYAVAALRVEAPIRRHSLVDVQFE